MTTPKFFPLVAVAAVLCIAGSAFAEQIDNPEYVSWSKYKPGTTVSYKTVGETTITGMPAPMKSESTMTKTLKEVKDDGVVVEMVTKMTMNGQETAMPPQTITVPAKIEKGKETPTPAGAEIKDKVEGTDTVDVKGKQLQTATHEFTMVMTTPQALNMHIKSWRTTEVPGGLVKNETHGTGSMKTDSTMTLVDFTIVN